MLGRSSRTIKGMAALVAILAASAGAGPRFLLESEQWINLAAGPASTGTYAAHAYDDGGRRLRTEVYATLKPEGTPYERKEYAYFSDGLPESLTTTVEDEVDSRVAYSYDGHARLIAATVSGADGNERYRDVLAYDAEGRLAEETRWRGGTRAFYRRFAYAADGAAASDTLFEPDGDGYAAVQATVHGPGRDTSERRESRHRRQGEAWYHVQDVFRAWRDGRLLFAVTYPAGSRRADSTAYAYDSFGNRVQEERFSGTGAALSRFVFTWRDTQVLSLRGRDRAARRGNGGPALRLLGGAGWRLDGKDLLGRRAAARTGVQGG